MNGKISGCSEIAKRGSRGVIMNVGCFRQD